MFIFDRPPQALAENIVKETAVICAYGRPENNPFFNTFPAGCSTVL
jgi:hypothetical protein